MVEARLLFGDSTVDVTLPHRAQVGGGGDGDRGPRLEPAADQEAAVREALARPLGLPRIGETVKPGDSVLIAFDDPTVPSFGPVRRIAIEAILEELGAAGIPESSVNLVCANALHRKWTESELTSILGPDLVKRFSERLTCHDAEDAGNLTYLGTTPSGYDVEVHRLAAESDLTVYVNAAVHLGFSGGWKSICVGLSTWRSIRWTHTPDGMSMSVRENRMHTVLDEMGAVVAANLKRPVFKVETVLANPATIGRVWAGGVAECRAAAVETQSSLHKPRRSEAEPAGGGFYRRP